MAAIAGRFVERLVAALLALANLHCVAVRLFSFRGREASPRPRTQQYHAQACSLGVPNTKRTRPHRADPWEHQVSALFGLRTMTDSTLSVRSTPLPQSASQAMQIAFAAFRRSQTVETVRKSSCASQALQNRFNDSESILNFVFDVFSILILFRSQIRRSAKSAKSRRAELRW